MPTDLITAAQAAKRLGLSLRRVQQLLAEGRILGARMIGGRWLIRVREGEAPRLRKTQR